MAVMAIITAVAFWQCRQPESSPEADSASGTEMKSE
jgi:hypothetical protein